MYWELGYDYVMCFKRLCCELECSNLVGIIRFTHSRIKLLNWNSSQLDRIFLRHSSQQSFFSAGWKWTIALRSWWFTKIPGAERHLVGRLARPMGTACPGRASLIGFNGIHGFPVDLLVSKKSLTHWENLFVFGRTLPSSRQMMGCLLMRRLWLLFRSSRTLRVVMPQIQFNSVLEHFGEGNFFCAFLWLERCLHGHPSAKAKCLVCVGEPFNALDSFSECCDTRSNTLCWCGSRRGPPKASHCGASSNL